MKNKIRVYLQYPWVFPDSPYYKYLLKYKPSGVNYINYSGSSGASISSKKLKIMNFFKYKIRELIRFLKMPFPAALLTRKQKEDFDIIHCAHCMSLNNSPWIMDIEAPFQFWLSASPTWLGKKIVKRILLKDNCKKILSWTEETKKEAIALFPELMEKIDMLYPAMAVPNIKKQKHSEINLLFVGRYFFAKGGLHALEIMDRLTKRYKNVKGIIISDVPEDIKSRYSANRSIQFYGLMPQEELFKRFYSKSDIFIYPGYSDSFGFAFLEAMAFKMPVVTVDGYARKEIIHHNVDGFVIPRKMKSFMEIGAHEEEMIKEMERVTSLLITNKKLRDSMSKSAFEKMLKGKFSVEKRNEKLKRIYEEALK